MTMKTLTTGLVCAALATIAGGAFAQETTEPGSRDDDGQSLDIEFSKTITMEMRLGGCEASLQMEYWQKGDIAEVTSTLDNPECGASGGAYRMLVRYRDDDGGLHTDEYEETWARDDAAPIVSTLRYPIGDDVDLVRVTSRGLSCSCRAADDGEE